MSFVDWVKFILTSNVAAAFVVGVFGLVTLRMGIKKYASEKWWERKAAAYAAVIEGLHKMHDSANTHYQAAKDNFEIDDDDSAELVQASIEGHAELRKGENLAPFLMSKRAGYILGELRKSLDNVPSRIPIIEWHKERVEFITNTIVAITAEAKRDLRT